MNIKELKDKLSNGIFYYCTYGALIKVPVLEVIKNNDVSITVRLEHDGFIDIFDDNLVEVRRPANIIAKFEWCYMILDHVNEPMGYIGKPILKLKG